ncbi:50S ribosomal protein L13 [bacterium]|uniref:Large ribosomal subunit protein uL13 n=2 Tax=Katanobacteria TaxID=422282 RepID=A0A2M7X041_UNCKA|nr:50S ribosomal protein L13 [bacterium]PIP56638.1 MAG: 50S ribosomal protein L13 [candidate division WWE3 bacterium CG22_combo_CG10-13_8_21_14_all_39_12]PJA39364.1 MAG: 50S ribosomal protein L13 [candidate division WWE3 bacterium CG_4_9_14_3_um_filter_39_7]
MIASKSIKPTEITRKWYIVDAKDHILGRMSTRVAHVLQGKNHAYYSPQWDMGDHVIVINAKKVAVTGGKDEKKNYYRHSGFPGGMKSRTLSEMREKNPVEIITQAVRGMLPKNNLARDMIKKLHVYEGAEHPYAAQTPQELIPQQKGT